MATFPPEHAGMARRDERQIEAEIDVGAGAEHELALVDLDLRLSVHREKELLRRRLAFLALLRRRGAVKRHARRDRGRVTGEGALHHLAGHQPGALGEAGDEIEIVVAERDAALALSGRLAGLLRRGFLRHRAPHTTGKPPMPRQPREKSRLPSCRSPNTTTQTIRQRSSSSPIACVVVSSRWFTRRLVTSSTVRKTSRPPSSAGTGRNLKSAGTTEMFASRAAKSAIPRFAPADASRTIATGPPNVLRLK